jgi:hypothetical protein
MDILTQSEMQGMTKTLPERDMYLAVDIRKYYRIGHHTLHKWMAKGAPYHIIGGKRWFSISELNEWMKEN